MALKQNNLAEATTELGFPAETNIPLQQEVELEDGTKVMVNGITPEMLAVKLGITYKTPGEPFVTSDGTVLNGVCQEYNENLEPDFETITLGGSYKFKLKQRLNIIDDMSDEELAEFFSIPDNSVFIGIGNMESGLGLSTMYVDNMLVIAASFDKDSERIAMIYMTPSIAQTMGFDEAGWYSINQETQYEPISIDEFVLDEIDNIQNNVSATPASLSEYASEKLDWLLVSAKSVQPKTLVSITVTTPPTKTEYKTGDLFDPTGMVVTATYDDNSTKIITDYTYSPSGELAETDTEITISYTKGEVTKTAEQAITVTKSLDVITFTKGKSYKFNYKAIADFIEAKLTEQGIYDSIKMFSTIAWGCGDNPPTINLGIEHGLFQEDEPTGIVETPEEEIAFGTDYGAICGVLSASWTSEDSFENLIEILKLSDVVYSTYIDNEEVTFTPSETITVNLMNSNLLESFTINENINWIEQVN